MSHPLFDLLRKIEAHFNPAAFTLSRQRDDAVMIRLPLSARGSKSRFLKMDTSSIRDFTGDESVLDGLEALEQLIKQG